MKLVSTRIQRVFMFIPIINWVNFFFWMHNCKQMNLSRSKTFVGLLITTVVFLPTWFLTQELVIIYPRYENLIVFAGRYIAFGLMGLGLIRFQEKVDGL